MSVRSILRKAKSLFKKKPNAAFGKVTGVIHVGGNTGQEIELYDKHGLSVVWIEPIPEIYEILKSNLANFPRQIAIKSLITDVDNVEYKFHLASNNGASSSIYDLELHRDIWPEVVYEKTIAVLSKSLPAVLKENNIDKERYDMLVMDTQGSELLVLKGAIPILQGFTYIKTEVPDFESYKGCCQLKDLELFMNQNGYREYSRHPFAKHQGGGSYYDITYKKK
jgi:FkbM family methyltransferase